MMYERYARIISELHEDFARVVNQEFPIDVSLADLELSPRAIQSIREGSVRIVENPTWGETKLFTVRKVIHQSRQYGEFSIMYRSYRGLVARRALEKYMDPNHQYDRDNLRTHGIFDFYLEAGSRYRTLYGGDATHYNVLDDLFKNTTYEQCSDVYHGIEINHRNLNGDQSDALVVLSWLFFEQELNYGSLSFQQFSNFNKGSGYRPRDMLMGFLSMMYHDEDAYRDYPYWAYKDQKRTSPHFGQTKFRGLHNRYKQHFIRLQGDLDGRPSLFCDQDTTRKFEGLIDCTGDNPRFAR